MRKFRITFDKPETVYAKKTRIAKDGKSFDFLFAIDPLTMGLEPRVELHVGGETLTPTIYRKAPRFFGSIKLSAAKVEDSSAKDCRMARFALDFGALAGKTEAELVLKYGDDAAVTAVEMTNYGALLAEMRQAVLDLALPVNTGKRGQYRAMTRAIQKLPEGVRKSVEAAELTALTLGATRSKPSRVFLYLTQIRKHYEQIGEPEKYAEFEALFNEVIAPKILLPHGYAAGNKLQESDPQDVKAMIDEAFEYWAAHGYDCFINSGSLLGLVRDGGFIEHDDDVDIGIILQGRTLPDVVREWLNIHDSLIDENRADAKKIRAHRILKLENDLGLNFDLFPAWFDEDDAFSVYPHSWKNLTRADVYPLQKDENLGIFMPANPEKMLESNYGQKWREPDPLFRFNWGRAAKDFKPFLKELDRQIGNITLTYGHFDHLTEEDQQFLANAAQQGSRLLVGCAADDFKDADGKLPAQNFETRAAALMACPHVDRVFTYHRRKQIGSDIKNYKVSNLVLPAASKAHFGRFKTKANVVYLNEDAEAEA